MTIDNPILDPGEWLVGLRVGTGRRSIPVDLFPIVYEGGSAQDPRYFRNAGSGGLELEKLRVELLYPLVQRIKNRKLSEVTKAWHANSLKRFVRWVDEKGEALNRDTIVELLARCEIFSPAQIISLKRLVSEVLNLSHDERQIILPSIAQNENTNDGWCFLIEYRGPFKCDFLRFINPAHASLSGGEFARHRSELLSDVVNDNSSRADLVKAIRDEFRASIIAKLYSDATLATAYTGLRRFFKWVDLQPLSLDKANVIERIESYSQHLTKLSIANIHQPKTVRARLDMPIAILASALNCSASSIRLRLSYPSEVESGRTTARPETHKLKQFCSALHSIVEVIPSSLVCAPRTNPTAVALWSGDQLAEYDLPEPIGGYGDQGFDARIANLPLLKLRIWAEIHRFIAFTGANLSVVQSLTVGQWIENRHSILFSLKARANRFVAVRVCNKYALHVDAHIEFIRKSSPVPISDTTQLFPNINTHSSSVGMLLANARANSLTLTLDSLDPSRQTSLHSWWSSTKIPRFGSRDLRFAKASWLLRRYAGDTLRVAAALGNTPQVAFRSYGGKGNLEQAIIEWSGHWSNQENSHSALAPGNCNSPGHYKPISDIAPRKCTEGACLTCQHYRGEDSYDYAHRLLSYRHILSYRAQSNSEISILIGIIDQIIDMYKDLHPEQVTHLDELQSQIRGSPHPSFEAMIRLMEMRCVS